MKCLRAASQERPGQVWGAAGAGPWLSCACLGPMVVFGLISSRQVCGKTCLNRFFCRFQTFLLYQEPRGELPMRWLVASAAVVRHITFFCFSCDSSAGSCPIVVLWLLRSINIVVLRFFSVVVPRFCIPAAKRHVFAANVPMSSPLFQPRRGFYASNYVLNVC